MCAQKFPQPRSAGSRIEAVLVWLGGGHTSELDERHQRSTHAIAGLLVLLGGALAWLVAALAVAESTRWPMPAVVVSTLLFSLLVGAVTRAVAGGPRRSWPSIVGRGAVAVAVGVVVGELAALAMFSGAIDRRLDLQVAGEAESVPAVAQAAGNLNRARDARTALDAAVEQARGHRDEALVVARCEFNPTPACPPTRITGVPGAGAETRTANELLAGAQRELDNALATRDRLAPELDARIGADEQTLARAREAAMAGADRGLGARWVAMNDLAGTGALLLRLLCLAFFALLSLLPLILAVWRGETSHDRQAAARAERDRAELAADTAIAIKRAEIRASTETIRAEQQLEEARLAVEAETEIARAQHRRRVVEALDGPVRVGSQRQFSAGVPDQLPSADAEAADEVDNLPARVEAEPRRERGSLAVPTIPDVTKAAARWIRPLVPPLIARAIDTTTHPVRSVRQVFEETEEITFRLKRTRKVTVSDESPELPRQHGSAVTNTGADPRELPPAD